MKSERDNIDQAPCSEHVVPVTASIHADVKMDMFQSGASHPPPFRRTRSQIRKENIFAHPHALASPFHIAAPSSSRIRHTGTKANKETRASKFLRRQSADVFRAHTSPSASFRRRPSGSHALERKAHQTQDWLVPPAPPAPIEENRPPFDPDIDLSKSHSFFSPQGFSTPLPLRRSTEHGTPVTPRLSLAWEETKMPLRQGRDIVVNDATPVHEEGNTLPPALAPDNHAPTSSPISSGVTGNVCQSIAPISHRKVHLPHDSIFSSFDVSASAPTIQVDPILSRYKVVEEREAQRETSRTLLTRTDVSDGDKLQDMFSVLDLAGSFTSSSMLSSDPLPEGDNGASSRDSGIGINDQVVNWDEREEKKGTAIDPEHSRKKEGKNKPATGGVVRQPSCFHILHSSEFR
ncbi:hypothetical protein JB92DRAFT_3005211 [Gautieria morchelliformis]|nr:hypothetical protein JB92DRAFT_3005211 [Gautieria morchelliformis]